MKNPVKKDLRSFANPTKAKDMQRFFKTGPGEYGEGDIFLGLTSEQLKGVAKKHSGAGFEVLQTLLNSKIHEERSCALVILVGQYQKSKKDLSKREEIFEFYLKNAHLGNINNWDLVDISAPKIVGDWLLDKDRKILYTLAESKNLWERRISIISTFAFIREGEFDDALNISEMLIKDRHDLIHKAVGWMLREIGKKDERALEEFLEKHCREMPRTMLRYSIEKMDKAKKEKYMKK
ncbi:MAG: DNA alkylation repair protein [Candidatus Aenigmarchaeota archaeon]|nr:DNA alkylation repair protein [Candidatus Aenigmarchaeota archaeon]